MTRDEAVALVLARCVRTGDTALQTIAQTEMRFAIEQVLEKRATLPWFLRYGFLAMTASEGNPLVAVPTDVGGDTGRNFLREVDEDGSLWILPADGSKYTQLVKDDYDALYNQYGSEETASRGIPRFYALSGSNFRLVPTPDADYTLRGDFYIRDTRLTSNIENNWLAEAADLVIAETGIILAGQYLHDDMLLKMFGAAKQEAERRLWQANEARMHSGRQYEGGD